MRGALAIAVLALAGCSAKSSGTSTPAGPSGPAAIGNAYHQADLPHLSDYALFDVTPGGLVPKQGVVPYDVNTPLFSDYALKTRTLYLPPRTSATYSENAAFDFPVGTIVTKTFAFADDVRAPKVVRRIETRLLIRAESGWVSNTYRWNDAQTDADLFIAGAILPLSFVGPTGETLSATYLLPNGNQCKKCHENEDKITGVIGLKARHLNRDLAYPDGTTENQLTRLSRLGMLAGAPTADVAPRLPVWDDPSTGTVEQRSRAWMDTNCAHCHSEKGTSRTTGLFLDYFETEPYVIGVCKPPVAAGKGTGGFLYDIVPGSPETSILMYRLRSVVPDEQMPELGRSVIDEPAVSLIGEWIKGMNGVCPSGGI
jgi:uncharacterized repeat protein (TIGR03806 family)